MNNRFKFRVWDKFRKDYIYSDKGYQGHFILTLGGEFYNLQNGSGKDEYVVQQYTGLKDKNGREIYEGDLVNLIYDTWEHELECDTNQEVFFDEGIFYFGRALKFATNDCNFNKKSIEVVGNIFENKKEEKLEDTEDTVTDGYQIWSRKCDTCGRNSIHVVRPGKVQCGWCE